jgi:hypothetical protein
MDGLTEGRIVHYVLPDGPSKGQHRPAVVVRVWREVSGCEGYVNLRLFMDGQNDMEYKTRDHTKYEHLTSVCFSADARPGTWHWIEKA